MANPIRVLVIDDSSFMRNMLVRLIEKDPQNRFEVIDTAVNGQDGLAKVKSLKPDVVTLDIEMPIMNGIECLKRIMKEVPTPVLMISTLTEEGAGVTLEALQLGAVDFLPKALKDKDRNIFSAAEQIYAKVETAACSNVGQKAAVRATVSPPPVAPPPAIPKRIIHKVHAKILIVGSSTGGPRALQTFVSQLPATLNVPIVIAQHMPASFTKALAHRLNETCPITVKELEEGEILAKGTVYILPGGIHTSIKHGASTATPEAESLYKPSVDVLGNSIAKEYGGDVLAVMLTGMGNDGAKAFTALKQKGAHVIGQDAETCTVYGMPKALADMGGVSEVLPLDQIGKRVAMLLA